MFAVQLIMRTMASCYNCCAHSRVHSTFRTCFCQWAAAVVLIGIDDVFFRFIYNQNIISNTPSLILSCFKQPQVNMNICHTASRKVDYSCQVLMWINCLKLVSLMFSASTEKHEVIDPYCSSSHIVYGLYFLAIWSLCGCSLGFSRKQASNDSGVSSVDVITVACILQLKYIRCVRDKSAGLLDVGVGRSCRSLRQ